MTPLCTTIMIHCISQALKGKRHVAVGASSPIPAAGALLAQSQNPDLVVSILGSEDDNPFTDGGRELFDCAAQGRIDCFFFSGVQIDKQGQVNLLGIGTPPHMRKRFLGNFGAPYLAGLIPNILLFRTDHSPKSLVETVDFVSAVGHNVKLLVTDRAVFERRHGELRLQALHPGETFESVAQATGFAVNDPKRTTQTMPAAEQVLLQTEVLPRMAKLYPAFVETMCDHTRSNVPQTKS